MGDHVRLCDTPIAVVGLGGLYPRSRDVREFWSNIADAVDCITDVPQTHWRIDDYYDPDPAAPDKTYCRKGGFLPTTDFNPVEFGMPPATLEVTDVLQLLSLVVARETLADTPEHDRSRTGVILGITGANSLTQPLATRLQTPLLRRVARHCGLTDTQAEEIADQFVAALAPWEENSFPGMLGNVVAGRIANRFDLGGTNCTVDAACASSLAAVHMAAAELVSGRADLMISGGCDAENTIFMYLCFSKTPAFSPSERIRPFDADADGTLIGEGIGMLALKRLADAERDGDRIYSVLRGIGSSSDGRFKSIYAPRAEGQTVALRRAYDDAGLTPADIGLVECHGTGTAVGDDTELGALREVYEEAGVAPGSVAVGSIKSQIGHTKAAAGAAGLIKLSLALHQKVLPPTINVTEPAKGLHDSPFHLGATARPWVLDPARPVRRAAVSSFGFGGTNFHCVLEEHDSAAQVLHRVCRVHLWHAADPAELVDAEESDGPVPEDHARLAIVARDDEFARLREQAIDRLRESSDDFELPGIYYRRRAEVPGKVAVLFAGQGSQYAGMGTGAALAVPPVRAAFDEAAVPGLAAVVFPPTAFDERTAEEQETSLRRTDFAQPAIGALSVGHFRYLHVLGFEPEGALGHSFGELTALWCAGSLSDSDFFRLAAARGRAMAGTGDSGAMAAVSCGLERVRELLAEHPDLSICNVNSPEQVVVGGATEAVERFVESCAEAKRLPVAAAFHTDHVAHAVTEFRSVVEDIALAEPSFPVYANSENARYGPDVAANRGVLVDQLLKPVLFAPRVEEMYADGFRVFVELGPKKVLGGLVRRTLADHDDVVVLSADAGPRADGDRTLKQTAAQLAVLGVPLAGFNRFTAPAEPSEPVGGMTIPMNGVNHVSDERRAHRAAMEESQPTAERVEPQQGELITNPEADVSGAVGGHLSMHEEYLNSQLKVAERLTEVLQQHADGETPDDSVISGINAVTEHSVAIGQSHIHASEVLRSLVQLDTPGATVDPPAAPPAPRRYEPAPPVELEPASPEPAAVAAPVADEEIVVTDEPEEAPEPAGDLTPAGSAPAGSADDVRSALLAIVAEKTGYPTDMLDPAMDVEADLGIDSIKRVEIMGGLREQFPDAQEASPEQLAELRTLDDIVRFVTEQAGEVTATPKAREGAPGIGRKQACLLAVPAPDQLDAPFRARNALVVGSAPFAAALAESGWTTWGAPQDVPDDADLDLVVHADGTLTSALLLARDTHQRLTAAAAGGRAAFLVVTRLDGLLGFGGVERETAVLGGLPGLVKTLAIEAPSLFCRVVDLAPSLTDERCAALLLAELHDAQLLPEIAYDAEGVRRVVTVSDSRSDLLPSGPPVDSPGPDDLFVVTGGGRGVTAACVVELARRYRTGLLLLGRTALADEPSWAADVPERELRGVIAQNSDGKPKPREVDRIARDLLAQREIRDTLSSIRSHGAQADYVAVDVTDARAVAEVLAGKPITGVVHGAGVLADQLIADKTPEDVARVLAPKLTGLASVLDALELERLRHVVLFSSVAGFFGNRAQSDYAMANEALNRIACSLKRSLPSAAVTAINWGAWEGGMVTPELARMFASRGIPLIPLDEGVRLFADQFTPERSGDVVCVAGPTTPLSTPDASGLSDVVLRRDIRSLADDPVLASHALGGTPVLPATAALGAILNVVSRVRTEPLRLRSFSVLRGLRFDDAPDQLEFALTDAEVLVRDPDGKPRYRAEVVADAPAPETVDLPAFSSAPVSPYDDGALFHGPALRGIHALLAEDDEHLVLRCELTDASLGDGGYRTARYSPVLADLLLQAALVRVHRSSGRNCLPTAVGAIDVHDVLPDGSPFVVVVRDVATNGDSARCTVTACAPDGRVLLRFTDVDVVCSEGLAEQFTSRGE
ncbi:SDR family NAD(P)-dependent oxidoreductase [Lentzea sp. NEAU-D13]|uniref:SDR family NAD(P)-dependent oxidoreductase n=1 Tax=Lentzea alba TaxID=2714351 RepID=A0A7C9W1A4_9PSEU|nr:type I polyketide synthase [Lentzea alba]NGY63741.1 SDR family NAD(P)-dependent oxidoreductase [Lentzea alba]